MHQRLWNSFNDLMQGGLTATVEEKAVKLALQKDDQTWALSKSQECIGQILTGTTPDSPREMQQQSDNLLKKPGHADVSVQFSRGGYCRFLRPWVRLFFLADSGLADFFEAVGENLFGVGGGPVVGESCVDRLPYPTKTPTTDCERS